MSTINFTIRKNDTARTLNYALTMAGAALDLSTATAVTLVINTGDNIFNRAATIVSAESGSVSYDLVAEDSAKAGCMFCNFVVDYNDGTKILVPTTGHIIIDVREDSAGLNNIPEL